MRSVEFSNSRYLCCDTYRRVSLSPFFCRYSTIQCKCEAVDSPVYWRCTRRTKLGGYFEEFREDIFPSDAVQHIDADVLQSFISRSSAQHNRIPLQKHSQSRPLLNKDPSHQCPSISWRALLRKRQAGCLVLKSGTCVLSTRKATA